MNPFQPIRTIRSQVYQAIKEQIFNGTYSPGFWLQEQEIAASLQVSRSPVREALRQIVADGLADEIPNKGVFVRRLTRRDMEETFELRSLLESYAIRRAYQPCTEEKRRQLEHVLEEMEQAHAAGDNARYTQLDSQLHRMFIEHGGNRLVAEVYMRAYYMVQQFRIYSLKDEGRFHDSLAEHKQIVASIVSGDCEGAVARNRAHFDAAWKKISEMMDRLEWSE